MDLIHSVSGRIKGQDTVVQEQFSHLLSLLSRDIGTMISDIGIEFLCAFGCGVMARDSMVQREMRKLYVGYKGRDSLLLESKKSILYSLVLKTVIHLYSQVSDAKTMRIADATIEDLKKERAQMEEGTLDKFKATALSEIEIFARIRNIQSFLKNFFNSIMMHVLHIKGQQQGGTSFITKQQDEVAFVKFIEDICRYSFSSPNNYPLLLVIKTCLHRSFLTQPKLFDVVIKGVQLFVDRVRQSSL